MKFSPFLVIAFGLFGAFSIAVDEAHSLTKEQLERFDEDRDGNVDRGKETVFFRHLANPMLAKYDRNLSGQFEGDEIEKMNADVRAVDRERESADVRLRALKGVPVPITTTYEKVEVVSGTDIKYRFYLRKNRADIGLSGDPLKSLGGAAFSVTEDVANSQTAVSIQGAAGVLFRKTRVDFPDDYEAGDFALTAYAFGPYMEAKGTFDTANTRLTGGVIGKAEFLGGPLFDAQLFSAAPYFQTDFDGRARIYGGVAGWQPFNSNLALGTFRRLPGGMDFTWLLNGEADYKFVDKPGTTGLSANSDHFWLGANGSARLLPFADQLNGRFFLDGSLAYYYNFVSGKNATLGTATAGFNLDENKNTAIELVYTNGRDHNTMTRDESYKATFTLKY